MKRTHSLCVSAVAGAALVALSPAPAQAQCFKITDLGKIRSGQPPGPFGINNFNQAVFTVNVNPAAPSKNHAFVYLPVADYGLAAGCHDLHLLGDLDILGFTQSVVHDINHAGIAVGSATDNGVQKAFVWRLDSMEFFDLGTYLTGTTSVAWAINDESPVPIIVGEGNLLADCECPPTIPQNDDFVTVAYSLELTIPAPTLVDADQLEADPGELCDFQTFARDVSTPPPPPVPQLIDVAGFSAEAPGVNCIVVAPCVITEDATVWFQGATVGTALNDQSAGGSECRGVGDNGGYSGWRFDSGIQNECQPEALYWHSTGVLGPVDLGSLIPGDGPSQAERITSTPARRQVVGWAIGTPDLAHLWECSAGCASVINWALTDLNDVDVIGRCSDNWSIEQAYDVNDGGVIIASGFRTGQGTHALLLTPDPTCCPADLDGNGEVGTFDLLILQGSWGPCPDCGDCGVDCVADLDCDCDVGISDLNILLGAWGPCDGSDGGSSHHALEEAVQEMGYDDLEDYHEWLAQASDVEALASGWVLYALLTDGD